jgi:uncharacterized protein YraI
MTTLFERRNVSRRSFLKQLAGGSAALALSGALVASGVSAAPSAGPEKLVTSSALNLRAQPSLSSAVLLVIPAGAQVGYLEDEQDGFTNVSYAGSIGWAKSEYLSPVGGGGSSDYPPSLGYKTTLAYVNMRSGPGTGYSVIRTLPQGTSVEVFDSIQGNFQMVGYAQQVGWISLDYLSGGEGGGGGGGGWEGNPNNAAYRGQATTASAVNMRNGGGMNYDVKLVIPGGAVVDVYDDYGNYFWLVNYNGEYGWVHDDFLIMDSDQGSDMPEYTGMGTATATVNLRAGSGTGYQVLAVVPAGASVELYAGPAGSWARVRYNGQFGYIHSDYIASTL